MNKWALSLYIHCKNKGVMVAHLVSYSHRFKEFYGANRDIKKCIAYGVGVDSTGFDFCHFGIGKQSH